MSTKYQIEEIKAEDDPEFMLYYIRTKIISEIDIIRVDLKWTLLDIQVFLGISQKEMNLLLREEDRFSIEQLVSFEAKLDALIEVKLDGECRSLSIREKPKKKLKKKIVNKKQRSLFDSDE